MLSIKEKKMAVQVGIGAYPDGKDGPQTWDYLYRKHADPKVPYAVKLYNQWCFVTKPERVGVFDPNGLSARNYSNFVSGSFSWAHAPISIMVNHGKTIRAEACHAWIVDRNGKPLPESVLWYKKDGTYGISVVAYDWEIPGRDDVVWAIGGAGLADYAWDPYTRTYGVVDEGFVGPYADVFRYTTHILVGFDPFGYFNAVYVSKMNGTQMKALAKKLCLTHYILLDGGHVTACNVDGIKRNTKQAQHWGIQL